MQKAICNTAKISEFSWSSVNPFVSVASAQPLVNGVYSNQLVQNSNIENVKVGQSEMPVPVLILLLMFFIFVFVMSIIYTYHWSQFNLGDKFIKSAITFYFLGLALLSLPLILFLI